MEEQIKIIEIPDFLKVKIVKINEKHCAYYVEEYSNEYFYADEDDFLKTHSKSSISYTLSIDIPFTISVINVEHLEEAIYKLYRKLTQNIILRAELKQNYYIIDSDFSVRKLKELNYNFDYRHHSVQNYFLSESQAKRFASKQKKNLIDLWKEELNNGN